MVERRTSKADRRPPARETQPDKPRNPKRGDTVPLSELEAALEINRDDLEAATEIQPEAFYRVAKQCALAISMRDAAYQNIKEQEAEADRRVRDRVPSDEKITEKEVEAQRRLDPKVKQAIYDHQELAEAAGILAALKEAFQMRSYALKDLVAMHMGNRSMEYGGKDPRADDVRERANEERRSYVVRGSADTRDTRTTRR